MIFDIDDIIDEPTAKAAAESLVREAIVASEATRRKRQKVRSCTAKIRMLCKICRHLGYDEPINRLKKSFEMLEEERGDMDVNLFGI